MFWSPSKNYFLFLFGFCFSVRWKKIFLLSNQPRLVSKIQLKTYFAVSTLFIVSLASFVGERNVITQTSNARLSAAERFAFIAASSSASNAWFEIKSESHVRDDFAQGVEDVQASDLSSWIQSLRESDHRRWDSCLVRWIKQQNRKEKRANGNFSHVLCFPSVREYI